MYGAAADADPDGVAAAWGEDRPARAPVVAEDMDGAPSPLCTSADVRDGTAFEGSWRLPIDDVARRFRGGMSKRFLSELGPACEDAACDAGGWAVGIDGPRSAASQNCRASSSSWGDDHDALCPAGEATACGMGGRSMGIPSPTNASICAMSAGDRCVLWSADVEAAVYSNLGMPGGKRMSVGESRDGGGGGGGSSDGGTTSADHGPNYSVGLVVEEYWGLAHASFGTVCVGWRGLHMVALRYLYSS